MLKKNYVKDKIEINWEKKKYFEQTTFEKTDIVFLIPPVDLPVIDLEHDDSYDSVFFENTSNVSFLHWNID